jgi:flavin-dependent dehydrogenase
MRAVPHLARWTDPDGFEPITEVMPGGGLTNTYAGQSDLAGLFCVGDSVCTTNPAAGRGISLGLKQATALLAMIAEDDRDPVATAQRFEAWCDEHIKPWYEDHLYWDATLLRRFRGEDIDLDARIPSDLICAAADVDPAIMPAAGPYMGMMAPPSILLSVEERARAVLRSGWGRRSATADSRRARRIDRCVRGRSAVIERGRPAAVRNKPGSARRRTRT